MPPESPLDVGESYFAPTTPVVPEGTPEQNGTGPAEPAESAPRWWIDAADLLGEPDPGPTPWLVEGLIVDRAFIAAVGRWKTTKSYGTLHLCVSIASGRPAFGSLKIPEPGPVVFCNEESGRAALWRRLDSLARGYAIDPEELRGKLILAANARIKLDDPGWQDELVAIGCDLRPRLFVFDPLARMKAAGRKENEQDAMAPIIEFARYLRDETDAAVAVVHHTGHTGEHMRGSSDLESAWETRLTWKRDGKAAIVTLSSEHREAEAVEDVSYRIAWDGETRTMRFDCEDTPASDALTGARDWILRHVAANPGQPRTAVEQAFAAEYGKGGRTLARRVVDGELTASTPTLAKGSGQSPNGVYLYPASQANLPLADPSYGEYGEQAEGAPREPQLANSPRSVGAASTASGEQPGDSVPDQDEVERLAVIAEEPQS